MFTGIVEAVGTVKALRKGAHSAIITVEAPQILDDVHLGDSIAVNGVCLTVTAFTAHTFDADIMHETLDRSDLGALHAGSKVNVERAMAANGRFGGHIVSGHIDGVAAASAATSGSCSISRLTTMRSGSPSRLIRASFAM